MPPDTTERGDRGGRDRLSSILRRLRGAADGSGLSQAEAARRAGITQASVSRYEAGKFVPALGDVRALARAYHASQEDVDELEQLVSDLRENSSTPARLVMRRAGDMQRRVGRIEAASVRIATFQPILFAGLLQSEVYARAVFSSGGDLASDQVEEGVNARLARAELLEDTSHKLVAVHTEGVLRWPLGGPAVMAHQLDHVVELSFRPNVHIGVIPWDKPVNVAPLHGFDLYDERAALVGTETATGFLTDTHDVAAYLKLFDDLAGLAEFDDAARSRLAEAADSYRQL